MAIVELIGATTTKAGLRVERALDSMTGRSVVRAGCFASYQPESGLASLWRSFGHDGGDSGEDAHARLRRQNVKRIQRLRRRPSNRIQSYGE
jgi:hypothetical protein